MSRPGSSPLAKLVGLGALFVATAHTVTDAGEWIHGGFSTAQLWLNYLAFLPVPAVFVGLYTVQLPRIRLVGIAGALGYGFAFVYFAYTTLYALAESVPTYEALWERLGATYTVHGVLMIVAGGVFGIATWRARVLPRWSAALFLAGLGLNGVVGIAAVPEILQTVGTLVRNAGIAGMGWYLLRTPKVDTNAAG